MKHSHQKRTSNVLNKKKDARRSSTRKANRKAARKKKKEKKNLTYLHKFSKDKPSLEVLKESVKKEIPSKKKHVKNDTSKSPAPAAEKTGKVGNKQKVKKKSSQTKTKASAMQPDMEEEIPVQTNPYQDAVMAREQKQLQQLEKQLKLKKRSSLPKSFMNDGLDFLLDVVDSNKLYSIGDDEELAMPDLTKVKEKTSVKKLSSSAKSKSSSKTQTKRVRFALEEDDSDDGQESDEDDNFPNDSEEDESEEQEDSSENEDLPEDSEEDEEFQEQLEKSDDEMDVDKERAEESDESDMEDEMETDDDSEEEKKDKVREDIYGRLIDARGNLVSASQKESSGAYIPPAKRAAMLAGSGKEALELDRLQKQIKGLLNRATESNMQGIAKTVEDLYMHHSRASVNQSLFALIQEAVVSPVLAPVRLVAEMVMLVAILHGNVGVEVGAYFLQHVAKKYEELLHQDQYGGQHTMDNIVLLLCYLYNFKIANHTLLFEVVSQFVEAFTEKGIEMLLLILKSSGFYLYLRRDDPESLGNTITSIQQKAQGLEESGTEVPTRVRFMLDVLVAVRNNNVRRVPGADIERTDRFRQMAGKFVRDGSLADNQLNIGLKDLLQAEDKGRWWIVGSAWEGRMDAGASTASGPVKTPSASSVVGAVSEKLVRMAKKLRINSDVRRSIFYILMSSEDYEDAFQKVLGLGLKGKQQQEVVVVAVLCCKQEASYNPFYAYFLDKLAIHERKFMIAIQFHMWDHFKTMDELGTSSRNNLAALLAHLFASKSLSLSVLKVLEFGVLDKAVVKFLRHVLTILLTTMSLTDVRDIFRAVAKIEKFRPLADGLRMFFVKYVKVEGELKKKLEEVCEELSLNHQMLM